MDPLTSVSSTVTLVNGALAVGQVVVTGLAKATRNLMLTGTYDPNWLTLGVFEGEQAELSAQDIEEIHLFLSSSVAKPILSLLAISLLLEDVVEGIEVTATAKSAFLNETKKWSMNNGQSWHKKAGPVFDSLVDLYGGALPSKLENREFRDEVQSYSNFLRSPLVGMSDRSLVKAYINQLAELLQDLPTLESCISASERLVSLIKAGGNVPIIAHSTVDTPVAFDKLYVNRDFLDISTNESRPSDALIRSSLPFRMFIMGSPGAGKTTFVNYLVSALTDDEKRDHPLPSAVVRCRAYARDSWDQPFKAFMARELSSQLQTDVSTETVGNLLLLGRLIVIFDGLDEITDVVKRQQMVQRIQAFTAQYPPVSILITTRELGYQQAPLDQKIFNGVRLQEFSYSQVEEYCTRWFAANERTELTEHFMRDSKSVSDLRENPLLLSLLCILYRNSGAIPANRRSIYQECAQLLFHRWDKARQIKTNEAMPEFGDELMQEIARWTFTSESAQAGLQEQVLVKTLANYLESVVGYNSGKALAVASEFAEYCAGRAWLLGTIGNVSGQRVFAFTHRTFYEYFAAEAYARAAKSEVEVAHTIKSTFAKDSTSVLPELLIQSYGYHNQRGDSLVFQEISQNPTPSVLLLRLINGSRLNTTIRAKGFTQVINEWKRGNYGESFNALLSTNEAARDQFWDDFICPPECRSARELFVAGWSSLQLSGTAPTNLHVWDKNISVLLDTYSDEIGTYSTPSTINWLLGLGLPAAEISNSWEYLVCYSPHGWVPGAIWWSIERALVHNSESESDVAQELLLQLHKTLLGEGYLPQPVLERLVDALTPSHPESLRWDLSSPDLEIGQAAQDVLAFLVLAISETEEPFESLRDAVSPCWPGYFAMLPDHRNFKLGVGVSPRRRGPDHVEQTLDALPHRLHRWTAGEIDLLDENVFGDDEISIRFRRNPPTNVALAIEEARDREEEAYI